MKRLLTKRDAWTYTLLLFVGSLFVAIVPPWPSADAQNALLFGATIAEAQPATSPTARRIATAGDSSMMFMNAAIAEALPGQWIAAPASLADWTSGTGGLDRNGCGVLGDELDFYYTPDIGPSPPAGNHAPNPESTCDWERWIPEALEMSDPEVLVVSFGPSSMWGHAVDENSTDLTNPTTYATVLDAHRRFESAARNAGVTHFVWFAYAPIHDGNIAQRSSMTQFWARPEVSDAYFELLSELSGEVIDLRDLTATSHYRDGTHLTKDSAALAAQRLAGHVRDLPRPG